MAFSFGALKEIEKATGIDFMNEDPKKRDKEIKPESFERIAQAGIRWSDPEMTDEKAAELAQYVTMRQVITAMTESMSSDSDEPQPASE